MKMLQYTQYEKDINNRIKEITLSRGRLLLIAAIVALVLTTYYLVVGIAGNEPEALKMGWMAAFLCLVCLVLYWSTYSAHKKIITAAFEEYAVDGKIDFTLERVDRETLKFTRLTDNKSFEIRQSDIKSVRHLKTVTVLILKEKRWLDLPLRADIDELIADPQGEEKK